MKKLKSSTFTPPILKFIALTFQKSFSFVLSSYQKKRTGDLKFVWRFSFALVWFHTLGYISALPAVCLQLTCSMPRSIKILFWWKSLNFTNPKIGPTWPQNLCAWTAAACWPAWPPPLGSAAPPGTASDVHCFLKDITLLVHSLVGWQLRRSVLWLRKSMVAWCKRSQWFSSYIQLILKL